MKATILHEELKYKAYINRFLVKMKSGKDFEVVKWIRKHKPKKIV